MKEIARFLSVAPIFSNSQNTNSELQAFANRFLGPVRKFVSEIELMALRGKSGSAG